MTSLARKPHDLGDFRNKLLAMNNKVRVAITYFDLFPHRRGYDVDLTAALRWFVMDHEARPLTLLVQSRSPFAELLLKDHPLSAIDMATVELA